MYGYIYKITNTVNGKIYVGQKKSKTVVEHYYGSGKLILQAIEKYGKEKFTREILQWCDNLEELNAAEVYWIDKLDARTSGGGYNISAGGTGRLDAPESRQQLSESLKRYYSDPENRQKQGETHKGYSPVTKGQTKETSEILQRASSTRKARLEAGLINPGMKGKHHSQETITVMSEQKIGANNPFYGKHHTETSKASMRAKLKGRTITETQRAQISAANSGQNNGMYGKDPVNKNKICITNGVCNKYISLSELDAYTDQGWRHGCTQHKKKKHI